MRSAEYKTHPLAAWLPMMTDRELALLVEDLKAHGQHDDIVLYEGKILDGRNREAGCRIAGIEPRFREYDEKTEGDPAAFVVSMALHRRHWNESQKAIYAALAVSKQTGRPSKRGSAAGLTQRAAAEQAGVGERTVRQGAYVREHGIPELVAAVEAGELQLQPAAELAKLPRKEQLEALQEKLAAGGKRKRDPKPANDEKPKDSRLELLRIIRRALEKVGASVSVHVDGLRIAFHGAEYQVNVLGEQLELEESA